MPNLSKGGVYKIERNAKGWAELEDDLAVGLYAVALATELEAKREAPVRGGYRSFQPGSSPIGGTLRRSIHSVGFSATGRRVGESNEAGLPIPPEFEAARGQAAAYVGTNSGYGAFVELGTSRMPARAFLAPAFDSALGRAVPIIRDAVARVRARGR